MEMLHADRRICNNCSQFLANNYSSCQAWYFYSCILRSWYWYWYWCSQVTDSPVHCTVQHSAVQLQPLLSVLEGNPLSCGATRPDNLLLIMEAITCKKIRAVLQILQLTPDVPICTNLSNFNISRQFLWITQLPVRVGIAQAV
jgi:hypothetical protein